MAFAFEQRRPKLIGNKYLVMGTMDRQDWRLSQAGKISHQETIKRLFVFKDVLNFEMIPAGWYRKGEHPLEKQGEDS